MGKVAIEGMQFYAHHGYYHEEQKLGGHYNVDVYVDMDLSKAAKSDELEDTDESTVRALVNDEYKARSERIATIDVVAFDWNCPQHITQRFTDAEWRDIERASAGDKK